MTTEPQPLAVRDEQSQALTPREVISNAKEQADILMEIVEAKVLFAMVGGKRYLEAEAWEIILSFNKVAPDVVYVKPIYDAVHGEDDELVAYEAKVNLIDQFGVLRGSGVAECGMDSFPTRGRTGRDKDKAAKSAAQTWAISKAARMAFSWVAVLAGFEPTPASEMKGSARPDSASAETAEGYGICPVHDEPYFKSGRMKTPAHKLNGGWCNKPVSAPSSPAEPTSQAEWTVEQLAWDKAQEQSTESDGEPALFPPEQASTDGARKFTNAGQFRKALDDDFGLKTAAEVNAALDLVGLNPLAQVGNFAEAYATIAYHFAEQGGSDA